MKIAVLNPKGKDADQSFENGIGQLGDISHPPINYHAYAACAGGVFCQNIESLPAHTEAVILLLRRRIRPALKAAKSLVKSGLPFWIIWKESGLHQVSSALNNPQTLDAFLKLAQMAEGFLSSTPDLLPLYRGAGMEHGCFIPTPYPLEFPEWKLKTPIEKRSGIFIGTREFDVPSRNHLAALLSAAKVAHATNRRITFIVGKRANERRLAKVLTDRFPCLRPVFGPLPYAAYLQLMSQHELVYQLDRSRVPGQVAGDALLCDLPCIGGDGAIETIAFPLWNGQKKSDDELADLLLTALKNNTSAQWGREAADQAIEKLGFRAGAATLEKEIYSKTV
ncbi:MAG: hypothetical protein ACK5LK_09415 [Chthoniobacterales bacterium]